MDTKGAGIFGVCILVGALVLALVPRALTRPDPGAAALAMRHVHSPQGNLVVDYMVETSPTSAEGGQLAGVTDIEFHEGYVVVKDREGRGRAFFGGRTRSLSWSETKR
jgi:hypothetical protein